MLRPCWQKVPTAKVKVSAGVMSRSAGSTRAQEWATEASNRPPRSVTTTHALHTPRLNGIVNTFVTVDCDGCRNINAPLPNGRHHS